jgi:hypothetical protein
MMMVVMVMLAVVVPGGVVGAVLGRGAPRGAESGDEGDRKGGGGSGKKLHVFLLAWIRSRDTQRSRRGFNRALPAREVSLGTRR